MFWNRMKAGGAVLAVIVGITGTAGLLSRGLLASALSGDPEKSGPAINRPSQHIESSRDTDAGPTVTLASLDPQAGGRDRPASSSRQRPADATDEVTIENSPPVVVKTVPISGAVDVDPSLTEIRVTFSKPMMDKSWSWSTASKNTFPDVKGDIHYLDDRQTCILPVKLQPGKTYATWINSGRFNGFKDRDRRPAVPYLLVFRTRS